MTAEELKNVIKLLITTLDGTTWDEGHPGYSDSEPGYNCPECSCKDCYRVSCEYNESEIFKKLCKEFPELYENKRDKEETAMTDKERAENFTNSFDYTDNSNYENDYQKASEKIAYEAYLEGLNSCRQKWHDLRKDKNDLPDNSRYVWTNAGAGYHDDDGWWDAFGRLQGVISWCEPQFEK